MSNVRGWVGALWMVLLGAGCTVNLDFDALSEGDGGKPKEDAGAAPDDPRDTIGSRDAGRVTIGPIDTEITFEDGGKETADGGTASDAGKRPPWSCAGRDATFCEDFETPPLEARWVGYANWKSMLSIAPDGAGAATALLNVPEGAPPGGGTATRGFVSRTLANIEGKPVDIQVDFDMNVEVAGQPGFSALVFEITLEGGQNTINEYVLMVTNNDSDSHAVLELGEIKMPSKDTPLTTGLTSESPVELRRWVHVSFLLHLPYPQGTRIPTGQSAAANTLSVTLDGTRQLDGALQWPVDNTKPFVVLGLVSRFTNDLGPWRVRYDNVEVQVKPL